MDFRTETDALGPVQVPSNSEGGSFYARARANFQISNLKAPAEFEAALRLIKQCAAHVNAELGVLDARLSKAIFEAAEQAVDPFDIDVYQAGAGTPYNMHMNEVLANRANVLLGGRKGDYSPVHPNNHVNMGQSSNDVTPTAVRLAALMRFKHFAESAEHLIQAFQIQEKAFSGVVKTGRTHLQDAVPVTLGQEMGAYASALSHGLDRLRHSREELCALGLGGTAIGSGLNAHPQFAEAMARALSERTGFELSVARNKFETTHSMAPFAAMSSGLALLATELLRISNDLRLMASGPQAGFNEIVLPEVEPGSSIMPGKVNPSVCEMMSMICLQVTGLHQTILLAAQQGQLELNWHTPLIMWDLLHALEILGNGMRTFADHCVSGLVANVEEMRKKLEGGPVLATVLAPVLGYAKVADMVHEAKRSGRPFGELVPEEYRGLLDAEKMT